MAELKTQATDQPVPDFLATINDDRLRSDCTTICELMEDVTGSKAKMWGTAIVGVGNYRYQYANGKGNDWFMMGFSPRKANISLYILGCSGEPKAEMLSRFGKHTTAKGCIYVKKIDDIDLKVLRELCEYSYNALSTAEKN